MMEREFGGVLVWMRDMFYYSNPPKPNLHPSCTSDTLLIRSGWILEALVLVLWGDFVTFTICNKPKKHWHSSGVFVLCLTLRQSRVLFNTCWKIQYLVNFFDTLWHSSWNSVLRVFDMWFRHSRSILKIFKEEGSKYIC